MQTLYLSVLQPVVRLFSMQAILEVADEQGADLIVLSAGRAMLEAASPETVLTQIIRHARCPVLIVPEERMNRW